MKIFDCDWTVILEFIPVWDEMKPASRKIFLDPNKPHTGGAPRGEDWLRRAHERFFFERLVPLGCVDLAEAPDGRLCFTLNSTGLYFLTGTGTVAPVRDPDGSILIQPNFEIVFTQPNPMAEAELAGLAERCGRRIGTLFRLTRETERQTTFRQVPLYPHSARECSGPDLSR